MAKPFAMDEPEKKYGETRLVNMINRSGQAAVARKLGVSQATVSGWLKRRHYTRRYLWVKRGSEVS